jgi:hypothetical protein
MVDKSIPLSSISITLGIWLLLPMTLPLVMLQP